MTNETTRSIFVHARTWFDKSGGNSYFSARIFVNGKEVIRLPFSYGYGSQFEHEALRALQQFGYVPAEFVGPLWALNTHGIDAYSVIYSAGYRDTQRFGKVD